MKDSVNILFVCGYGVGSSVMLQTVVKKALAKYDFSFDMEHTAVGEVGGFTDWADIYAISKNCLMSLASILNTDNISFPLKISWMANQ